MIPKSLKVFSTFSEIKKKEFDGFLRFRKGQKKDILSLTSYYNNVVASDKPFSKEDLNKFVFKNEKISDVKLRLLQSELQKSMEEFIVWQSLDEHSAYFKKTVLNYYKEKNIPAVYQNYLNKYKAELGKSNLGSLTFFEEQLILAEELYENAIQQRKVGLEETKILIEKLDFHFILKKLKYACLVSSQENIYNITFNHGLNNSVLRYIEEEGVISDPVIGTYFYCYKMLTSEQRNESFQTFFQHLKKYGSQFSKAENTELYTLAINYCIRALNQGNKEFGRKGIEFYKFSLDEGILLNNGRISKFTFRNIITMAIRIQEFELAERFINKYQNLLANDEKDDMVHFTSALILFSKKEYEKASDELLQVHFKDLLFNLATKGLQLKIYFESKEYYVLQSHLDALQIFLKRHKSLGYHKQNYLNIISYTRKLMNARTEEKLLKLRKQIESEATLTEKRWLLEKIKEMA